jgi:hypothetical protein
MRPFILIISFLFVSCNDSSHDHKLPDMDSSQQINNHDTSSKIVIQDTSKNIGTVLYVWVVDIYNKTKKRNPNFKIEYLNIDTLIKGLNELHPNIKLDKVKMRGDTLFTKIIDSEYLGERIGTDGAALYLAGVIINLTSIDKVKYVKIDFDDGSHASPGIWSAKDFSDYKEIR